MNIREALIGLNDDISCDTCGNCCPSICPSKKDNLCIVHPSKFGVQEFRSYACTLSPVELTINFGVACKPVGDKIKDLTGVSIQIKEEPLQIFRFDSIQLESILNQDI